MEHEIDIRVVVNGQPTDVKANPEAPLETIVPRALQQTGNTGQPVENWELRDAKGELLDLKKKIEDYHFPKDVTLFLNLKAGIGG